MAASTAVATLYLYLLLGNCLIRQVIFWQAFQELWTNDRLLNCVEQMIGPDIAGHPVWNLRTKVHREECPEKRDGENAQLTQWNV